MKLSLQQPLMQSQANRDIALATVVSLVALMLLIGFDVSERYILIALRSNKWLLYELPSILLVVYIALAWFAIRRWYESRLETATRIKAEQTIAQLLDEKQQLLRHSFEVQEEEKRSLARELHDELGQYLHAARTEVAALRLATTDKLVADRASNIERSLTHVQLMARNVIRRLRPTALDELGLSAALEQLVQRQCETANLSCKFDISRKLDHVTGTLAINAYRIVQESLTNVVRHAAASHVVFIAGLEQRQVLLAISDNGQGYPETLNAGFGITGIRERVEGLGGNLNIQSEQGQGVKITVSLPLNGKC